MAFGKCMPWVDHAHCHPRPNLSSTNWTESLELLDLEVAFALSAIVVVQLVREIFSLLYAYDALTFISCTELIL